MKIGKTQVVYNYKADGKNNYHVKGVEIKN